MRTLQKYQLFLEAKKNFSPFEVVEVFDALRTSTDPNTILSFLKAWSEKGITSTEIVECAKILRESCVKVETKHTKFIDIVGTGGSKTKMFNISTASAFVVAGAGVPVAKHGNRAASSKSGSADVLLNLGVEIGAKTSKAQQCLDELGICFMFAPKFHKLTRELAVARKSLGQPTIFNLLGPLANPAKAPFQLIGVWKKDLIEPLAKAVVGLGTRKTWIVRGKDGLDEITLNGKTYVAEIFRNEVNYFEISPEDFGFRQNRLSNFRNIQPRVSAKIIKNIFRGEEIDKSVVEIVLINSAAAIYLSGFTETFKEAAKVAQKSIESGSALAKLNSLIDETNR